MKTEKFKCTNCDGEGSVKYDQTDTRFSIELLFCPFCGAGLDNEFEEPEQEDFE